MPELPDLEVIASVLTDRLGGRRIQRVTIEPKGGPIVVRDLTSRGFAKTLSGMIISDVSRRGKFLVITFAAIPLTLIVNFKLTGRFQLCVPDAKKAGPVHATLHFLDPQEQLRYIDRKKMGQLYLTDDPSKVPEFTEMGPDALAVTREDFHSRLSSFRGEIKGILTRERFISGIGNAYADEILWASRIHPFRKRPSLQQVEIDRLYDSTQKILLQSIEKVKQAMGNEIHLKPRGFFAVHMRADLPCPQCGTTISSITANKRITNFCRTCQPGGLIKGM